MWVLVDYYEVMYIGQIVKVISDDGSGKAGAQVKCLSKVYDGDGVVEPHDFEKKRFWVFYPIDRIFVSPVTPKKVKVQRAFLWKY